MAQLQEVENLVTAVKISAEKCAEGLRATLDNILGDLPGSSYTQELLNEAYSIEEVFGDVRDQIEDLRRTVLRFSVVAHDLRNTRRQLSPDPNVRALTDRRALPGLATLGFDTRIFGLLNRAQINYYQLFNMTDRELLVLRQLGPGTLSAIREKVPVP